MDSSDDAIVRDYYLEDVQEDINEDYEDLMKQDEIIQDTIDSISDIASISSPSVTGAELLYKDARNKVEEVEEDFTSYAGPDDKANAKDILQKIESVMDKAKTSDGKTRFADFEGASGNSNLAKLNNYNEQKQEEQLEKAEYARDDALKDHNKQSSKDVVNKAFQEYKSGDLSYDEYTAILDTIKNTSENMDESTTKENATDSFIEYLEDRDMLEDYLKDYKTMAEQKKIDINQLPGKVNGYFLNTFTPLKKAVKVDATEQDKID